MKQVIGVVGPNGSGKGTFTEMVKNHVDSAISMRFSDILKEMLEILQIPITRENLQDMAIGLVETYGEGTVTNAMKHRIINADADIIILEGIRWMSDLELLRSFENSTLVYITADPKIRFERMKQRKEKEGEDMMSYEQFLHEEEKKTEQEIKKIGENADYIIENNGTLDEFKTKINEVINNILT